MTTEMQWKANQQNAGRSSGPRTPEGKRRASQNAEKHGLYAKQVLLRCEDEAEFQRMVDGLMDQYAPVTETQGQLVIRLATTLWQLRRFEGLEDAAFARIEANRFRAMKTELQKIIAMDPSNATAMSGVKRVEWQLEKLETSPAYLRHEAMTKCNVNPLTSPLIGRRIHQLHRSLMAVLKELAVQENAGWMMPTDEEDESTDEASAATDTMGVAEMAAAMPELDETTPPPCEPTEVVQVPLTPGDDATATIGGDVSVPGMSESGSNEGEAGPTEPSKAMRGGVTDSPQPRPALAGWLKVPWGSQKETRDGTG